MTQFKIGDIVRYTRHQNCFGYIKAIDDNYLDTYVIGWFDGFRDTTVVQSSLEKVDKDGNYL